MPIILAFAVGNPVAAENTQVQVRPEAAPVQVLEGGPRAVAIRLHNPAATTAVIDGRIRVLQTSSTTTVRIGDFPWKKLELRLGETLIDSVTVTFPTVKAETRFLIQWLEATNHVFGMTEVFVHPTNLLARLKTLAGDEPVGVYDPANQLKPLFRSLALEFQDLLEEGTDKYVGKLAIFGPFESTSQMQASLKDDIRALAKRGVAVVWLQPPPDKRAPLKPSFYAVSDGESTVVVAAHDLVVGLVERPEAQMNLLQLAEEALNPTTPTLPETETSN